MTSLPTPADWTEQSLLRAPLGLPSLNIGGAASEDEQFLLRAFRSFSEVAGSLERSYQSLSAEVERLRRELEKSNSDLAYSLEQNRSIRQHLDCILEGLPCGVLVVSSDGGISRANPEALRLIGAADAAAPARISELSAGLQHLLDQSKQKTFEPEMNISNPDGVHRWLSARHASIAGHSSVFILRDVSERKCLEETQARARRDQALAEMSAILAHEVRNPLGSLELFAGLLADSSLDGESRQWVEHIQAGLRTLAATVNNVLNFHTLPELERAPVDLGLLLDWARNFFAPLARQSRIALSSQNRVSGVLLFADRHRLEGVLSNLVLNSARAMPGGGWIELGGRILEGGKAVALSVADTGPGISPENLPHIFEAGFSTRGGSPGLGLAVCHKVVEQHGGTIVADSKPGRGAVFTLTFPLATQPAQGASE
jgi:two-component system sensor histidine kinase FlrB